MIGLTKSVLCPFFTKKRVEEKQTKTYGLGLSWYSLGRVGRFSSQPCPSKRPTATR